MITIGRTRARRNSASILLAIAQVVYFARVSLHLDLFEIATPASFPPIELLEGRITITTIMT